MKRCLTVSVIRIKTTVLYTFSFISMAKIKKKDRQMLAKKIGAGIPKPCWGECRRVQPLSAYV